jgi:predicted nucleic acid-binding protein
MQVLFDTNVILDVLLKREPWYREAAVLWQAVDDKRLDGFMAASVATDLFYIAKKVGGIDKAKLAVRLCPATFKICAVDRQTLELAYTLSSSDFEDNVLIACASLMGIDAIVTRNPSDFASSSVAIYTPESLCKFLELSPE